MQLAVVIVSASHLIADANMDHREEWVVRIQGGSQVASLLAAQSGYKHHGPVNLFGSKRLHKSTLHSENERVAVEAPVRIALSSAICYMITVSVCVCILHINVCLCTCTNLPRVP